MTRSEELFKKAVTLMPGGVNSPVRAFGSVGSTPRFIEQANGVYMTDVDGNKYLDFIGSWGPMILGHNHPAIKEAVIKACEKGLSFGAATEKEVEMAELMTDVIPSLEMVRMVNSGTEAVMSAIRAARGYTRRDKIVKFTGCYHGHSDALLVKAGAKLGYIDEERIIGEMAVGAYRAGADIYLTYFAKEIAKMMDEGKIG